MADKPSFLTAAYKVLDEVECPLTATEICDIAIPRGLIKTNGNTPGATLSAQLYLDIKNNKKTRFVKLQPGVFGLMKWDYKFAFQAKKFYENTAKRLSMGDY